ncbi:hypothetical protein BTA31_16100, partial [Bacillus haynesii]
MLKVPEHFLLKKENYGRKLKKEKYSTDKLLELLRKKNVFNIAEVQFAILEQSGDLNVLLEKEHRPVTIK